MRTAAELRRQVESALAGRIPGALSMRAAAMPELVCCGVAEVDAALGGGFPVGAITELTGKDSSGHTTLALSTLAKVTQGGESCAYVDASDTLDPLSAAALGVDLRRLLWVRAGVTKGDAGAQHKPQKPWSRLDQSLRAADLLLHSGGFRAIVLDMADIDPEHAQRVPAAMWYRFRLQAEKSQTLFLLLTRVACAHSCAAASLCCEAANANWDQATEASPALLAGLSYCVRVRRSAGREVTQSVSSGTQLPRLSPKDGARTWGTRIPSTHVPLEAKKPAASARPRQPALWRSTTSWSG